MFLSFSLFDCKMIYPFYLMQNSFEWKYTSDLSSWTSLPGAGLFNSGTCQVKFSAALRIEIPQPLWAAHSRHLTNFGVKNFLIFIWNFSSSGLRSLLLAVHPAEMSFSSQLQTLCFTSPFVLPQDASYSSACRQGSSCQHWWEWLHFRKVEPVPRLCSVSSLLSTELSFGHHCYWGWCNLLLSCRKKIPL